MGIKKKIPLKQRSARKSKKINLNTISFSIQYNRIVLCFSIILNNDRLSIQLKDINKNN